ncbi:hypothetical protein DRQ25_10045 [Candidatus Fermentibacteria bacterium]|nr:MAG: hypothetical protein DRQ25_10045 [Candidatus Fermentibacteria bacterium]
MLSLLPILPVDPDLQEYLDRNNTEVDEALRAVNDIAIRDILPDRPRVGKVYYIRGEGLFFFEGDEWLKILTQPA